MFLKINFLLSLCISVSALGQSFNNFKYVKFDSNSATISAIASDIFTQKGFKILNIANIPDDAVKNPCLIMNVKLDFKKGTTGFTNSKLKLNIYDCNNILLYEAKSYNTTNFSEPHELKCVTKASFSIMNHNYIITDFPDVENIDKDENVLKLYFDVTKIDPIEGIYKSYKGNTSYKIGIIKVGDKYKAIIIESDLPHWKKGDVKAIFESTAADGVFSTKFYSGDKTSIETFANLEGGLITVELKNLKGENDDVKLLKLYPKN